MSILSIFFNGTLYRTVTDILNTCVRKSHTNNRGKLRSGWILIENDIIVWYTIVFYENQTERVNLHSEMVGTKLPVQIDKDLPLQTDCPKLFTIRKGFYDRRQINLQLGTLTFL